MADVNLNKTSGVRGALVLLIAAPNLFAAEVCA
jgi:hypothetical protein